MAPTPAQERGYKIRDLKLKVTRISIQIENNCDRLTVSKSLDCLKDLYGSFEKLDNEYIENLETQDEAYQKAVDQSLEMSNIFLKSLRDTKSYLDKFSNPPEIPHPTPTSVSFKPNFPKDKIALGYLPEVSNTSLWKVNTNTNTSRGPRSIPNTNTNTPECLRSIPNTNTNTCFAKRSIPISIPILAQSLIPQHYYQHFATKFVKWEGNQ